METVTLVSPRTPPCSVYSSLLPSPTSCPSPVPIISLSLHSSLPYSKGPLIFPPQPLMLHRSTSLPLLPPLRDTLPSLFPLAPSPSPFAFASPAAPRSPHPWILSRRGSSRAARASGLQAGGPTRTGSKFAGSPSSRRAGGYPGGRAARGQVRPLIYGFAVTGRENARNTLGRGPVAGSRLRDADWNCHPENG